MNNITKVELVGFAIKRYDAGYAQALADVKAAVERLHIFGEAYQDREHEIIDKALAAIRALEGKNG